VKISGSSRLDRRGWRSSAQSARRTHGFLGAWEEVNLRRSLHKSASLSEPLSPGDLKAISLDSLLISGGDSRLHINSLTRLNEYGCHPNPHPEVISFSSSTASSISNDGYVAAKMALHKIFTSRAPAEVEPLFLKAIEDQRTELSELLGIGRSGTRIIFCPSGTDCQLHALYIARAIRPGPVLAMIAASDETGRGTIHAATGRHFSSINSQGATVKTGELISELGSGVTSVSIPIRTNGGALRPPCEIDAEVLGRIAKAAASGMSILFYAMHSSKTGHKSPSDECIREILSKWSDFVVIVIDCCQFRAGRKRIKSYINSGCMVMLTGSKFFSGPPFSGALVVPSYLIERLGSSDYMPLGFKDYSVRTNWPDNFTNIRMQLPNTINVGQFLRWTAALSEMRRYFAIPLDFRMSFLDNFEKSVQRLFQLFDGIKPLSLEEYSQSTDDEIANQTIFPFFVLKQGVPMSLSESKLLHTALNRDCSKQFSLSNSRILAASLCHVGQPVGIRLSDGFEAGALRISVGATNVSDAWRSSHISKCQGADLQVDKVRIILEKAALISSHFDDFGRHELS
jgi:hypothetical protein